MNDRAMKFIVYIRWHKTSQLVDDGRNKYWLYVVCIINTTFVTIFQKWIKNIILMDVVITIWPNFSIILYLLENDVEKVKYKSG